MKYLQGTVYGPSGIPLPQVVVQLMREGKFVANLWTDGKGKFEVNLVPGPYDLQLLFLDTDLMDLKVRVGHGRGFHSTRLRIVLGLSGTRCGFVTTSSKEFKKAIKRYQGLLEEKEH